MTSVADPRGALPITHEGGLLPDGGDAPSDMMSVSEAWEHQDSPRGAQGHMQRVSDTVVTPDLWASYGELLDHVDGDLDDLADHTKGCTQCRLSDDGSMCHTGHRLWLKARKARS